MDPGYTGRRRPTRLIPNSVNCNNGKDLERSPGVNGELKETMAADEEHTCDQALKKKEKQNMLKKEELKKKEKENMLKNKEESNSTGGGWFNKVCKKLKRRKGYTGAHI
ncbi:unnamed protein product [Ambrosiozyma monospora]|uniref:Unnamed protein product n=1 Tax=Ambrosiozyma monospora TaxID=43982 RepID=A0A9W6Z2E6_AMBMO|nr:unnamed protein product [Ambrosiozyma monospora]